VERVLNDSRLQFTENTGSFIEILGKVAWRSTNNYLCTFASAAAATATPDSVVASRRHVTRMSALPRRSNQQLSFRSVGM
jgi:hypothetical protein